MTRKENITAILECCFAGFKQEIIEAACNRILGLKPKTGHWITENMSDGDVGYRCSECNELFWLECGTPKDNKYNFCPKCGERLIEAQESEDNK